MSGLGFVNSIGIKSDVKPARQKTKTSKKSKTSRVGESKHEFKKSNNLYSNGIPSKIIDERDDMYKELLDRLQICEKTISQLLAQFEKSIPNISPNRSRVSTPGYSVQQSPVQQSPVQQSPVQQSPVQQSPVQPSPVQQSPVQPSPVQPSPVQPSPVQPSPLEPPPLQPPPLQPPPLQPPPLQIDQIQPLNYPPLPSSLAAPLSPNIPVKSRQNEERYGLLFINELKARLAKRKLDNDI